MSGVFLWSGFYKMSKMSTFSKEALTFQQQLENNAGMKLQLKINDNRSTMLSVKWEPDCTKVSLHRMFLRAPQNIMQALACYLRGEHNSIAPSIKAYIEDNLHKLDYSHQLDLSKLETKGRVYDLQGTYKDLNREYFGNQLNLHITWFGKSQRRNRNRITFGLYHDPLKLIKINRLLDNKRFPDYFVSYVIYHEMLHYVCPTYVDEKGVKHIHSKEFKELEKKFKYFSQAQKWIRDNQNYLFPACHL
jgi:predicted SprT family Zn-dependent metalloprotease